MNIQNILIILVFFIAMGCSGTQEEADRIVHNAVIYTVDKDLNVAEAFVIKDGKILESGTSQDILVKYQSQEILDAEGKAIYTSKELHEQNQMIPLGSGFPVGHINPLHGFQAAVAYQDTENSPKSDFQMENALSREFALKRMTIWAAYAAFEEDSRRSIRPNKWTNFVLLEEDIMKNLVTSKS